MNTEIKTKSKLSKDGLNLTASRRAVLDIVMGSEKPMKAYDILSDLQKVISHAKPPTVYRALEYLVNNKLLHRINQQNAYVFCQQEQKCFHDHPRRFNVIFTCQQCGQISEQSNNVLTAVISEMIDDISFKADSRMIECPGACKECQ
ncbi:MAG: Fur family transcriptional regulator [Pseudomonadota bacterium]|nr:Fur family transcriptional regulator [Pseudomonadota bacterium]